MGWDVKIQKNKKRTTIWSSNSIPRYISAKHENTNWKRHVHPNVHSSAIYNSQGMEATHVSINRLKDREDVGHIHTHTYTHTHTRAMEYYSAIKRMKFCHL